MGLSLSSCPAAPGRLSKGLRGQGWWLPWRGGTGDTEKELCVCKIERV